MKIICKNLSLLLALILCACSKTEAPKMVIEPAPAFVPAPPADTPSIPTTATTQQAKVEPTAEFALDCVGEKSSRTKAIFVSLGKKAMFTNLNYKTQFELTLTETTSQSYIYSVDTELTGTGATPINGKTITVNRENLSIWYRYGDGADPFACNKNDDPIKSHQISKKILLNEAQKAADDAEKERNDIERAKQEQLKRNKI